jgi:hydroxymethylpyrimidine pyrophosphatase-like HAD family hydrolase
MITNNNPVQKRSLSYEDIDTIIEIVNKHNLGPIDFINNPTLEKILSEAKTPEKRVEIIKNLPFNKIMDRIEEILRGKLSLKDLASVLQKDLNLPLYKAESIAREIKERVFQVTSEEKASETPPPPKRDIYREPIE